MRPRIFLTGATGYIGQCLLKKLLAKNYEIIVPFRGDIRLSRNKKVRYLNWDFDSKISSSFFSDNIPTHLIHCAWGHLDQYQAVEHTEYYYPKSLELIHGLMNLGCKDITVLGTCFEYGLQEGCLDEKMDMKPVLNYGLGKVKLLEKLMVLAEEDGAIVKWIRLFYPYSTGMRKKSLFGALDTIIDNGGGVFNMSPGDQIRDYLFLDDMVLNILKAATNLDTSGIYNNCSGAPATVENIIKAYIEYRKFNLDRISFNKGYYSYPDYEPMHFWGDNSKLNRGINSGF